MVNQLGSEVANLLRDWTMQLYTEAAAHAATKGIILADTKFEFGVLDNGTIILIDEILTPDSSRFWPMDQYQPGHDQPSFDSHRKPLVFRLD